MGLLAIGKSGKWQIDLDEVEVQPAEGKSCLGLTVASPSIYIQLTIADVSVISQVLEFLNTKDESNREICIGSCFGANVLLRASRTRVQFKILLLPIPERAEFPPLVELTLSPEEAAEFSSAFRDLAKDLESK